MQLLNYDDLAGKGIRYSRSQIWRKVRDKTFPAPIKLGAGRTAWIEDEIDNWISKLIAERDRADVSGA